MTNSRAKGVSGELGARKVLEPITGIKWRRTQQHSAAGVVGDIEPDGYHPVWSRLHVEVKNVAAMKIGTQLWRDAMAQAERDCPRGSVWVLLFKERRGTWMLSFVHAGMPVTVAPDEMGPALQLIAGWIDAKEAA